MRFVWNAACDVYLHWLMTTKEQPCAIIFVASQILHHVKVRMSLSAENPLASSPSTSSAHSSVATNRTKKVIIINIFAAFESFL